MEVTLSKEQVELIIESITYSIQRVRNARDTPLAVREAKLANLDLLAETLRQQKRNATS